MRKENHGFGTKYRFELVLIDIEWGKNCNELYRIRKEKSWVWSDVQIWILIFVKEKAEKLWVNDEVHIWFPIILYRKSAKKSWVWCEVQIWICIDIYRMRKKNHELGAKKQIWICIDLFRMRKKNYGCGAKYRFEFVLIYIEWGRKIMGVARSTDLNLFWFI